LASRKAPSNFLASSIVDRKSLDDDGGDNVFDQ
jgi:hypothetical protein